MDRFKVLIVDDEMPAREMIKGFIDWEQTRFEICAEAKNGKEALEILKEKQIDLVITDIQMPVMDGLSMLKEIETLGYNGESIVLSCHEEFRFAKEAMRCGVKEYLIKDLLSEMDLLEVLNSVEHELIEKSKENIHSISNKRETLFRREILRKLVITPQSFDDMILNGNSIHGLFNFDEENYSLFVVWLDGYLEQYEKLKVDEKRVLVKNSMEALSFVANEFGGEVFYNRKGEYIIVLSSPRTSSQMTYYRHCQERCSSIRSHLKGYGILDVTVGVSDQFSEFSEAHNHYLTAQNACKYRVFLGGGRNIFYNTPFSQVHRSTPDRIDEKLQKVLKSMHLGKKQEMLDLLEELYKDDFKGFMQYNYLKYVNGRLLSELQLYMEKQTHSNEKIFGMPFVPLDYLDNMETTSDMLQFWSVLSDKIFEDEDIPTKNEKEYGLKVNQAIDILREKYQLGIGLQEVADELGIHKVYLSRVFKTETGMTMSHFIQSLKMDDAKKMLSDTNMKVYDIAERLGYSQSQQFSVAFKKATGQTPHGYRKHNK